MEWIYRTGFVRLKRLTISPTTIAKETMTTRSRPPWPSSWPLLWPPSVPSSMPAPASNGAPSWIPPSAEPMETGNSSRGSPSLLAAEPAVDLKACKNHKPHRNRHPWRSSGETDDRGTADVENQQKICGPPRDILPERPAVNHPATRPGDSFLVPNKVMITASNL